MKKVDAQLADNLDQIDAYFATAPLLTQFSSADMLFLDEESEQSIFKKQQSITSMLLSAQHNEFTNSTPRSSELNMRSLMDDDTVHPFPFISGDLFDYSQAISPAERTIATPKSLDLKQKKQLKPGSNTFVNKDGKLIRGKPCDTPGCLKRAQSAGKCKSHGGGARCVVDGCTKSSQGNGRCRTHGGGKRCNYTGCTKGTQRGGFCYLHGGVRPCSIAGCRKKDRGTGRCISHSSSTSLVQHVV